MSSATQRHDPGHTTVFERGAPAPSSTDAEYFKGTISGVAYRAGGRVRCEETGKFHSLTLAQTHQVAREMVGGPLLWSHDTRIGHVGSIRAAHVDANGDLHVDAVLHAQNTVAAVAQLRAAIRSGHARCLSLGWDVDADNNVRFVELSLCQQGKRPEGRVYRARCAVDGAPQLGATSVRAARRDGWMFVAGAPLDGPPVEIRTHGEDETWQIVRAAVLGGRWVRPSRRR